MFGDFFKYWDELPEDGGFTLFDITHIGWLLFLALGIGIAVHFYKKKNARTQDVILKILTLTILGLEILKDIYLICVGHMEIQYLPLEMCGLAIFVELAYAFGHFKAMGEVMCIICMPGAMAALLFPDWTRYPFFNLMHINSFILHGLLVLVPVLVLSAGIYEPSIKRCYKVFLFLCIVVPPVYLIDIWQNCDFMFLCWPSVGSPFLAAYQKWGYSGYLLVYAAAVIACIFLIYGILAFLRKICRNHSATNRFSMQ